MNLTITSRNSHTSTSFEGQQAIAQLKEFSNEPLKEKMLQKGIFNSEEEFDEIYSEFLKFAYVTRVADAPVAMVSDEVDEVWHQFILFTREYQSFCNEYLGKFLHHSPSTSSNEITDESEHRFTEIYKANFGELHSTWTNPNAKCRSCEGK